MASPFLFVDRIRWNDDAAFPGIRTTLTAATSRPRWTGLLSAVSLVSEMERDFISARTKAALQVAKQRAVRLGGDSRGALAKANEVRQKTTDQAARSILKLLEPMRAAGTSLRKMAEALNATGLKSTTGAEWSAMAVKRTIGRGTEKSDAHAGHSAANEAEISDGNLWARSRERGV